MHFPPCDSFLLHSKGFSFISGPEDPHFCSLSLLKTLKKRPGLSLKPSRVTGFSSSHVHEHTDPCTEQQLWNERWSLQQTPLSPVQKTLQLILFWESWVFVIYCYIRFIGQLCAELLLIHTEKIQFLCRKMWVFCRGRKTMWYWAMI